MGAQARVVYLPKAGPFLPAEGGAPASTQACRIAWCPFVWNPIRRGVSQNKMWPH